MTTRRGSSRMAAYGSRFGRRRSKVRAARRARRKRMELGRFLTSAAGACGCGQRWRSRRSTPQRPPPPPPPREYSQQIPGAGLVVPRRARPRLQQGRPAFRRLGDRPDDLSRAGRFGRGRPRHRSADGHGRRHRLRRRRHHGVDGLPAGQGLYPQAQRQDHRGRQRHGRAQLARLRQGRQAVRVGGLPGRRALRDRPQERRQARLQAVRRATSSAASPRRWAA